LLYLVSEKFANIDLHPKVVSNTQMGKDSVGRKANVPSIVGTAAERFRTKLIETGVTRVDGDKIIFEKDHPFGSPSWAAIALMGRSANGWLEWKNRDGKTLDTLKRKTQDGE
jgi:hypothetical protein